jgi:vacuolar-type H+-ATPase subunit F/Vma7
MSRLLILTTPELAVGYRLAGATTLEVTTPDETRLTLEKLLEDEDGVIAVHAPYFQALPQPLRQRLGLLSKPLVIALPAGTATEQSQDRRRRLLELLHQAVGYEITFGKEGTAP